MGALALASKGQKSAVQKYHCICQMMDGTSHTLTVKATSEAEANRKVHDGYAVEYIMEILTPVELEARKKHLRRSIG